MQKCTLTWTTPALSVERTSRPEMLSQFTIQDIMGKRLYLHGQQVEMLIVTISVTTSKRFLTMYFFISILEKNAWIVKLICSNNYLLKKDPNWFNLPSQIHILNLLLLNLNLLLDDMIFKSSEGEPSNILLRLVALRWRTNPRWGGMHKSTLIWTINPSFIGSNTCCFFHSISFTHQLPHILT